MTHNVTDKTSHKEIENAVNKYNEATKVSPEYYHKVVDCQYACPAHTPVPEYIRLISLGKYNEAYQVNRESNVFPGVLGRVCDRPCEPACRRGRVEANPVAICRLKRAAADYSDPEVIKENLPVVPKNKNGKKIALIGAGPASLTVANDLLPLGYEIDLFEKESKPGGAMLTQVPSFRLPQKVLDFEIGNILDRGVNTFYNHPIRSLKELDSKGYQAIFIGVGAPQGRNLNIPGFEQARQYVHIGVEFLANVTFKHRDKIGQRVLIIGGGNTAMDCARTALRLGAKEVKVIAPEGYEQMLASPWEKEDAEHEGVHFINGLLPNEYICEGDSLKAMKFDQLSRCYDDQGRWAPEKTGDVQILDCDEVVLAIGQNTNFDFVDLDLERVQGPNGQIDRNRLLVDKQSYQTSIEYIFVGGDSAFGPKNIISAVADGHEAALSIHLYLSGKNPKQRPSLEMTLESQKMALNQWSYANNYDKFARELTKLKDKNTCLTQMDLEAEEGFTLEQALTETQRCLNCDVQTVFNQQACIECDACVDICPTECLSIEGKFQLEAKRIQRNEKAELAPKSHAEQQGIFAQTVPQTNRYMIKDENVCLHCGLCAERCPTSAWDMQAFSLKLPRAKDL